MIFTTAYDEFALKAFEVNALDYLVKPIEPKRLADAVQKLNASEIRDSRPDIISTNNSLLTENDQICKRRRALLVCEAQ